SPWAIGTVLIEMSCAAAGPARARSRLERRTARLVIDTSLGRDPYKRDTSRAERGVTSLERLRCVACVLQRATTGRTQRIAWTTGTRAARRAGKKPPSTPITTAKTRPDSSNPGVTRKLKAISLKLAQLVVLVTMPLMGRANRHPAAPPAAAMIADSTRKLARMLRG